MDNFVKRSGSLRRGTPLRTRHRSGRVEPDRPLATWCQAEVHPAVCTGRASHRHHIRRRSQGGTDGYENTIDLCSACHAWIHGHPAESYENGWLTRSEA